MKKIKHYLRLGRLYFHYRKKSKVIPAYPSRIWLEPTNACNLRCIMCPNGMNYKGLKRGMMEWELFEDLIWQISRFAYDVNLFHRGESLLHPRFLDMVARASGLGLKPRLHTNATLLDKSYSKELIKAGLDFISFSFDGYEKEMYEKIRRGAVFEDVLSRIIQFLEAKKELGSDRPYTILEVMEVISGSPEEMRAKREAFKSRFRNLPLDKLIVRPVHNWAGLYDKPLPKKARYVPCTFPFYSLTIFYDGKMPACPQDFFGEIIIGDAREKPLLEIWNDSKMQEMRVIFSAEANEKPSICRKCDMLYRETFLGIPKSYLKFFLRENL